MPLRRGQNADIVIARLLAVEELAGPGLVADRPARRHAALQPLRSAAGVLQRGEDQRCRGWRQQFPARQPRQSLRNAHRSRSVDGIGEIPFERRAPGGVGHPVARIEKCIADRKGLIPAQARNGALLGALVRAEAYAGNLFRREEILDRFRSAHPAQNAIVGRVVAAGKRALHQIGVIGPERAPRLHEIADRLMEQRQILRADRDGLVQLKPPLVHFVQRGQRDPQFADALLRKPVVAPDRIAAPGFHIGDGDADCTIERCGDLFQLLFEGPFGLGRDMDQLRSRTRFGCSLGGSRRARKRDDDHCEREHGQKDEKKTIGCGHMPATRRRALVSEKSIPPPRRLRPIRPRRSLRCPIRRPSSSSIPRPARRRAGRSWR